MKISSPLPQVLRLTRLFMRALRFPLAHLHFESDINPSEIRATHARFTMRHPRFKLIKNKSMGMALLDLSQFKTPADYLATVNERDYAVDHGARARARGYTWRQINLNDFIDDIHAINVSAAIRLGWAKDPALLAKVTHYHDPPHFKHFGVLNKKGKLVAYCTYGIYGNFAATDQLLGHKNRDGIMFLLLMEIICSLIEEKKVQYFMSDTYIGAQAGLRSVKRRVGLQPYRIHYSLT